MNRPRSPSLLVYLMSLFILLAFLLALTLMVTAGPVSDQNDNHPMNLTIQYGATPGNSSQCLEYDKLSVQETCPQIGIDHIFEDVD